MPKWRIELIVSTIDVQSSVFQQISNHLQMTAFSSQCQPIPTEIACEGRLSPSLEEELQGLQMTILSCYKQRRKALVIPSIDFGLGECLQELLHLGNRAMLGSEVEDVPAIAIPDQNVRSILEEQLYRRLNFRIRSDS